MDLVENGMLGQKESGPTVRQMYAEYAKLEKVQHFHGTKKMLQEQLEAFRKKQCKRRRLPR